MLKKIIAVGVLLHTVSFTANAAPITCLDTTKNHMSLDSSVVTQCLAAGMGNITGENHNDEFLRDESGSLYSAAAKFPSSTNPFNLNYTGADDTFGTWSFDSSFWNTHSAGAIGFKFGTGRSPDSWFVYELVDGVSAGAWNFIHMLRGGKGLSHMNLYGIEKDSKQISAVPVPAAIPLFLTAAAAFGFFRRRQLKKS